MSQDFRADRARSIALNRIPQVTFVFWLIKVLSTTSGETVADFLNNTLGWGLNGTTVFMTALLAAALIWQFSTRRYVPAAYWLVVILISVVGTLITDTMSDQLEIPLWVSTAIFAAALALTFIIWWMREKTLSIKTVYTRRREVFYWVAILFTFALGTAAGDLLSESLDLGYFVATLIFLGAIALVTLAWRFVGANVVACFWAVYILTRPLGASLGDLLSQDPENGGLGVGTTWTSVVFGVAIVALIITDSVRMTRLRREYS